MKTKLIIITLLFSLNNSFAMHPSGAHDHDVDSIVEQKATIGDDCTKQTAVKVNGMVCDFCARAVEKVFSKQDEVKAIDVDLDSGNIIVEMNPNQSLSEEKIAELVTNSGYDIVGINKACAND